MMSTDTIQNQVDLVKSGEVFKLDPPRREFKGPLILRRPIIIEGQGGTIWSERGPVVQIESPGVELRDVNVEITSRDGTLSGAEACALVVTKQAPVKFDHVSVRGNVIGLDREEGVWRCPRTLPLGNLKAGLAHHFKVAMVVPVNCTAESEIDGLRIEPQNVQGNPSTMILRLDTLPAGTKIRGQIKLKTAFLTRRIMVTGTISDTATEVGNGRFLWRPEGVPVGDPPTDVIGTPPSARTVVIDPIPGALDLGNTPTTEPLLEATPATDVLKPPSTPAALVVSQLDDSGQFRTIGEALKKARTGSRILVRPGVYKESLVLDRKVEIVGDGPVSDIVIEGVEGNCLRLQADLARVKGISFRGAAGQSMRERYAVFVPQGQLLLEDCRITSDSLACLAASGSGAMPVLRRCTLHGGKSAGLLVFDRAEAMLEDCEISECNLANVESRQGGQMTLKRCRIRDGKHVGVLVHSQGKATLEDCDISGHAMAGVEVRQQGEPTLRRCKVRGGRQAGVLVHDSGMGTLEDCDIHDNAMAGVEIRRGSNPTLRRCHIHDGKQAGVLCTQDGQGVLEDCQIHSNCIANVEIRRGANPTLRRCTIREGNGFGVTVRDKAKGYLEDCEIHDTPQAAVELRGGAAPVLRRCKIHDSQSVGVVIVSRSAGLLEECEISSNKGAGLAVANESHPAIKRCNIHDNTLAGAVIWQDGKGMLERCEITSNGLAGIAILDGGNPTVRQCKLYRNGDVGVWADRGSNGTVEDCDLTGNKEGSVEQAGGEVQLSKNKVDKE
jgi:parallel beta-helix repeat protein